VLVCLSCNEIYDNNLKNKLKKARVRSAGFVYDYLVCPKVNCRQYIADIDELFVPLIITLRNKDYNTQFCCSGHYGTYCSSYIAITGKCYISSIPDGCTLEIDNNYDRYIIRRNFDETLTMNDLYKEIMTNVQNMMGWAESIPQNIPRDNKEFLEKFNRENVNE